MTELETLEAELVATQASIKALVQPKLDALEAAKPEEQRLSEVRTTLDRAKMVLAKLQEIS